MGKLIREVTLILLDKSGHDPREAAQIAALIEGPERKGYGEMFEAVIDYLKEEREGAWERGLHQGRDEGTYAEKLRTAANLKQLGVPTEVIAQATGLSVEEIEGS